MHKPLNHTRERPARRGNVDLILAGNPHHKPIPANHPHQPSVKGRQTNGGSNQRARQRKQPPTPRLLNVNHHPAGQHLTSLSHHHIKRMLPNLLIPNGINTVSTPPRMNHHSKPKMQPPNHHRPMRHPNNPTPHRRRLTPQHGHQLPRNKRPVLTSRQPGHPKPRPTTNLRLRLASI